jgi:hypothetical protein
MSTTDRWNYDDDGEIQLHDTNTDDTDITDDTDDDTDHRYR